nr:uncharacterized protein LOC123762950 [Procambarus clarkii]
MVYIYIQTHEHRLQFRRWLGGVHKSVWQASLTSLLIVVEANWWFIMNNRENKEKDELQYPPVKIKYAPIIFESSKYQYHDSEYPYRDPKIIPPPSAPILTAPIYAAQSPYQYHAKHYHPSQLQPPCATINVAPVLYQPIFYPH